MELVGKLYFKGEAIKRTETFTVRDFVIEVENPRNPQWNDLIQFQVTNERCSMIDVFNIGELLQVTFEIRGRKWHNPESGRDVFFNTLNAWRIERYSGAPNGINATQANYGYPQNNSYQQQPYGSQPNYQQQTVEQSAPQQPATQDGFQDAANNSDDLPF